jgi:hypothetical protein
MCPITPRTNPAGRISRIGRLNRNGFYHQLPSIFSEWGIPSTAGRMDHPGLPERHGSPNPPSAEESMILIPRCSTLATDTTNPSQELPPMTDIHVDIDRSKYFRTL